MGVVLKVVFAGTLRSCSIARCLLLGSSGLLIYETALAMLPNTTMSLIAIGQRVRRCPLPFAMNSTPIC